MIHHDVKRKNQPQRLHTQTLSTNNSPPGAELPSAAGATAAAKPLGGQQPRVGKGNYGQFSGAVLARLLLQAQSCPLPPGHCCSKAPGGPKTTGGQGKLWPFFRGWLWKPLRTFAPSVPHRPSTESSTCQNTGQTQTCHAAGHPTQVGEANLHALGQTRGQISAANVGATAGKRGHPQSIGKMHAFHPSPLQSGSPSPHGHLFATNLEEMGLRLLLQMPARARRKIHPSETLAGSRYFHPWPPLQISPGPRSRVVWPSLAICPCLPARIDPDGGRLRGHLENGLSVRLPPRCPVHLHWQ